MIKTSPRAMGMVFALAMLVVAIICFRNYYIQLGQTDWIAATATVTQVKVDYGSTANGDYNIFYDIYYTYTVGGQPYNGMIDDMNQSLPVGEIIDIKYDPDAPDHSTDVTEPAKSVLIMGIVFGSGGLLWLGSHIRGILAERKSYKDVKGRHIIHSKWPQKTLTYSFNFVIRQPYTVLLCHFCLIRKCFVITGED